MEVARVSYKFSDANGHDYHQRKTRSGWLKAFSANDMYDTDYDQRN